MSVLNLWLLIAFLLGGQGAYLVIHSLWPIFWPLLRDNARIPSIRTLMVELCMILEMILMVALPNGNSGSAPAQNKGGKNKMSTKNEMTDCQKYQLVGLCFLFVAVAWLCLAFLGQLGTQVTRWGVAIQLLTFSFFLLWPWQDGLIIWFGIASSLCLEVVAMLILGLPPGIRGLEIFILVIAAIIAILTGLSLLSDWLEIRGIK